MCSPILLSTRCWSISFNIEFHHLCVMEGRGWTRRRVKVLIGGAPVTLEFAEEIRAGGVSNSGTGVVALAKLKLGLSVPNVARVHLCTH